jgi:hypothetical protein
MNEKTKLAIFVAANLIAANAAVDYVKYHRQQRKIRLEIEARTASELESIRHAHSVVTDRIDNGRGYNSLVALENDFAFERIAYHLEK